MNDLDLKVWLEEDGLVFEKNLARANRAVMAKRISDDRKVVAKGLHQAHASASHVHFRHLIGQSHPGVVEVLSLNDHDEGHLLIAAYVAGTPLSESLHRNAPLPASQVRALAQQLVSALHWLHDRGVTHGRVNPSNILMQEDGSAVLVGLSLAGPSIDPGETGLWDATDVSHLSPEQRHRLPVDPRSDQFALAGVLYQALTGKRAVGAIAPPGELNPAIPSEVSEVLMKALDSDAEDRWADMAAFGEAIESALARMQLASRRHAPFLLGLMLLLLGAGVAIYASQGLRDQSRLPRSRDPAGRELSGAFNLRARPTALRPEASSCRLSDSPGLLFPLPLSTATGLR